MCKKTGLKNLPFMAYCVAELRFKGLAIEAWLLFGFFEKVCQK